MGGDSFKNRWRNIILEKEILKNKLFNNLPMTNDELEIYLNSIVLCNEYYYPQQLFITIRKTNEIYLKRRIAECGEMIFKEYLYSSVDGENVVSDLYDINNYFDEYFQNGLNHFIKNLMKTLKEYIYKNRLPYIKVAYIAPYDLFTEFHCGSILIHADKDVFMLTINPD